jgi:hypothetical protein
MVHPQSSADKNNYQKFSKLIGKLEIRPERNKNIKKGNRNSLTYLQKIEKKVYFAVKLKFSTLKYLITTNDNE